MRKGRIRKFTIGVALAAAVGIFSAPTVQAQDIDGTTTYVQPAGELLMPFDNTTNHASFQIVTRLGSADSGPFPIATHWSYWAADCRHLVDVFVCLTPHDTKVMDPTKVQGETQSPNPPANNGIGSITDLSGERGFVTVTAFTADTGPSGLECRVLDVEATLSNEIVGGWVIANTSTNAAFGGDAIGLLPPDGLADASIINDSGLFIQTFNPMTLGDSDVIVIGAQEASGNAQFTDSEIGPIEATLPDGNHVCCNVSYTDNLEVETSLPDLCFKCVAFNPISDLQAEAGEASLIPPNTTIDAPGFIRLRNCQALTSDGTVDLLGADFVQFLFAVHGQAIGPFGAGIQGKYTGELF
jgi:hypothetical protein